MLADRRIFQQLGHLTLDRFHVGRRERRNLEGDRTGQREHRLAQAAQDAPPHFANLIDRHQLAFERLTLRAEEKRLFLTTLAVRRDHIGVAVDAGAPCGLLAKMPHDVARRLCGVVSAVPDTHANFRLRPQLNLALGAIEQLR